MPEPGKDRGMVAHAKRSVTWIFVGTAVAGVLAALTFLRADPPPPVELGRVAWGRDVDEALRAASASGKPAFVLFQEVPG